MIFLVSSLALSLPLLPILLHVPQVSGYTPASPSNVTLQAASATNSAQLHVQWHMNGSHWEHVTPQLASHTSSSGPVEGILVHFTEDSAGDETTTTPWIAFVSCDAKPKNPDSPYETDIFTLAKARGAKSVVLYSLYSETCVVHSDYRISTLDIFAIRTLNATRHIGLPRTSNETYCGHFNAALLNGIAGAINDTIAHRYPVSAGFHFATLLAHDTTNAGFKRDTNGTGTSTSTSGSQNTGIAMIVLYTITGCVSALFSAVIVSGAIRAIRYPERYGPRAADPTLGGGQSRARGLGRAILDTFPIVKFGSSGNDRDSNLPRPKDIESVPIDTESNVPVSLPNSVQLAQLSVPAEHSDHHDSQEETTTSANVHKAREDNRGSGGADQINLSTQIRTTDHEASRASASPRGIDTGMPDCIGRETCPICIVDFEEGDDLRVLPCEGKHRFHQSCVDPWLLELSGSCPICRQDFHALETLISGGPENGVSPTNRHSQAGTSSIQNRFSRYLRFTRRRQGRPVSVDQTSLALPES